MTNWTYDAIPEPLREGWEPTDAGRAWTELLGPRVPEDVKRLTPDTDCGFLLADPATLLNADNAFAKAIELAMSERVVAPVLQVMTSSYHLAPVPHDGDCLMFFVDPGRETAPVVVWNHETSEHYGPVAWDLPSALRVVEVAESSDDTEARRAALAPALGRWAGGRFPMSSFEALLRDDGVLTDTDDIPQLTPPEIDYGRIAERAYWVMEALVLSRPSPHLIEKYLSETPEEIFATDDFQDVPHEALYWLARTYFLGEDEWHQTALERCKESQARLVRDAAAHFEANADEGPLAQWREQGVAIATQIQNPYPERIQAGPLELVRDDSLAGLAPEPVEVPSFPCEKGQPLNPWWPEQPKLAVKHPDGKRWLVSGHHDHPRKGQPYVPNTVDALFEVDPETGLGNLLCDTPKEGHYNTWAEYLDENRLLVINNGRLRLYQRIPEGDGHAHLLDEVPLGQEKALVMKDIDLVMGYGGIPRFVDGAAVTKAESISGCRLVDGRLQRSGTVPAPLASVTWRDGELLGSTADGKAGYRFAGLTGRPALDRLVLSPTAFVIPEKVWRAGPPAVLAELGPMDVSIQTSAGLCLINKLVTDPSGARRAYVGNSDGIRPTEPAIDLYQYVLVSPTVAYFGTTTEIYRTDLATGEATLAFRYSEKSMVEAAGDGLVVLEGAELVARSFEGEELTRVTVGEGSQLLGSFHDRTIAAVKTARSPLVLFAIRDGALRLLAAVDPSGDLGELTFEMHAQPQWVNRPIGKAPDGGLFGVRGLGTLTARSGVALDGAMPDAPWEAAPLERG